MTSSATRSSTTTRLTPQDAAATTGAPAMAGASAESNATGLAVRTERTTLRGSSTGAGPPLVMLHGFGASERAFDDIRPMLEPHAEVITIDLRGHGASDRSGVASGYRIDRLVDDAIAVIEAVASEPVDLLGVSLGGVIAVRVAAARPDLVHSLVASDTSAGPEGSYGLAVRLAGRLPRRAIAALTRAATRRRTGDAVADRMAADWLRLDPLAQQVLVKELTSYRSYWHVLRDLDVPTTVIVGDGDGLRRAADRMHQGIAGSHLEVITDAGHAAMGYQPEMYAQVVVDHLHRSARVDADHAAGVAHLAGVTLADLAAGTVRVPVRSQPALPDAVAVDEHTVTHGAIDDLPPGDVRVRTYRPANVREPSAAFVWAHGGGWIGGDIDMVEAHVVAGRLAALLDVLVVSVDYSLAPAATYPQPERELAAAWRWATALPDVDAARVGIGGASAGGHLAAMAARDLVDNGERPVACLLAYPATDPEGGPYPDVRPDACPQLLWFTRETTSSLLALHRGDVDASVVTPTRRPMNGLPPTLVTVAALDALRPQAEVYAERLARSGIEANVHRVDRVLHGYLDHLGASAQADAALERHARWLAAQLGVD